MAARMVRSSVPHCPAALQMRTVTTRLPAEGYTRAVANSRLLFSTSGLNVPPACQRTVAVKGP